jgi:hypothetical protein
MTAHPEGAIFMSDFVTHMRAHNDEGARFAGFGSSNTEKLWHSNGCFSWFCWVECSVRAQIGRAIWSINLGISGNTCQQLVERFDRDVAPLKPTAMIVTIGGNDYNHQTLPQFERNLHTVAARARELNIFTAFNTYYSPMITGADLEKFTSYMDMIGQVAKAEGAMFVNRYPLFKAWWLRDPEAYRKIMLDNFHLNPLGHALFGCEVARGLGLDGPQWPEHLKESVTAGLTALRVPFA